MDVDDDQIPDPPLKPLPGDCCGNGCTPCVLEVYQKEFELWQSMCRMTSQARAEWRRTELQKASKQGAGRQALHPGGYRAFRIVKVVRITDCVYKYTFELARDEHLGMRAGQHAMLRLWEKEGVAITRPYTPISPLTQLGSFEVLIKIYEDGQMTQHLKEWDVGTTAEWRGPLGDFTYTPNRYDRVGMLACGTGIAPLLQVARSIVDNEEDNTFVHLLYCCRTQYDILMKDELDRLASFWNFSVLYALSSCTKENLLQDPGLVKYGDKVHHGRAGQTEVVSHMPRPRDRMIVYICGTASFQQHMVTHLTAANFATNMYFIF